MSKRLTGLNPLAYMGVEPLTPPNMYVSPKSPTSADVNGFNIGDFWVNSVTRNIYFLANLNRGIATWTLLSSGGGGTVTSVTGGNNITVTGTATDPIVNVSGTTDHAVQVGNATGSLTSLSVGTNGQLLLGSTAANPSFVTPTAGTGLAITTNSSTLSYALSVPVSIANGGTNATSMTTTDGVVYFDGTSLVTTAVGTATQVLTSNGAGVAPTFQAAASGGITTIAGNVGSVTGSTVTLDTLIPITGAQGTPHFEGSGSHMWLNFEDDNGDRNVCIGLFAYTGNAGADNVSVGQGTLGNAGFTGELNIAFGTSSGGDYTGSESSNIVLNHTGVTGDNNTLRIGTGTGSSNSQLNKAFIAGIQGITVTGTAVLISSSDQLGIAVSSARFKSNIHDMGDGSEALYNLRPVTFNWNKRSAPGLADSSDLLQYGLIAEETAEIVPHVVNFDNEGRALNINYQDLIGMMINEIQRLNKRVCLLEKGNK